MPRNGKLVRITLALAAAALVAALAVVTAGSGVRQEHSGTVNGAGSTFVAPLVTKWMSPVNSAARAHAQLQRGRLHRRRISITNKQVDFGASDAPLSQFSPTCTTLRADPLGACRNRL